MLLLHETAERTVQQARAVVLADLVADGVSDDRAGDRDRDGPAQRHAALEGEHASEEDRDLAGEDEAEEDRGFERRQREDDRVRDRSVQVKDPLDHR